MIFKVVLTLVLVLNKSAQARVAIGDVNITTEIDNSIVDKTTSKPPLELLRKDAHDIENTIDNTSIDKESGKKVDGDVLSNSTDETEKSSVKEEKEDVGTALILTKFIEEGKFEEARAASKVDEKIFPGYESYSGFLTVNKTYDSNLFFWYFPVDKKPVNETPWIIWLQGGPGVSSLSGLFEEIGPYVAWQGKLKRNRYSWIRNHSLLFIDNPVGTGFSFTNHSDGYAKDMAIYSNHLITAVKQFLQIFPKLRKAPLFICGESYAGKYVPALAMEIHKIKNTPEGDINLKGLIIGNALVNPIMLTNMTKTFYNFGLIDQNHLEAIQPLQDALMKDIAENKSSEAKLKFTWLVSLLLQISNQASMYNFLYDDFYFGGNLTNFLDNAQTRKALHVGTEKYSFLNYTVNFKLFPDFLSSTRPFFEILLEEYNVLSYCGQLDMMIPCMSSSQEYRSWNWNSSDLFQNAARHPLVYNGKSVGFYKSGGRMTEVLVKGAGHIAPKDKPSAVQALVARWTSSLPLSDEPPSPFLEPAFVDFYIKTHSSSSVDDLLDTTMYL